MRAFLRFEKKLNCLFKNTKNRLWYQLLKVNMIIDSLISKIQLIFNHHIKTKLYIQDDYIYSFNNLEEYIHIFQIKIKEFSIGCLKIVEYIGESEFLKVFFSIYQ